MGSINDFRTRRYRVFYAAPYFNLDLKYEINWHKKHLKKLHEYTLKPHKFHKDHHHDQKVEEIHKQHYKEHVLDAIPFHQKLLHDQQKKYDTILSIMPKKKYERIMKISRKHGGTPEFFVYDKLKDEFFFVAEHLTEERKKWIELVKEKHKLCDVIILK